MKHKNVKAGQRVIIKRSPSASWADAARYIGEEFTVTGVEALDYKGEGTVLVQKVDNDAVQFWCNHRDLRKAEKNPGAVSATTSPGQEAPPSAPNAPEVGDLFRVAASDFHGFEDGVVRLSSIEPDGIHNFENFSGETQFVESPDLTPLSMDEIWEILKSKTKMGWPWPKGTPVEVTDEGREHVEGYLKCIDLPVDTPLFLGSDGSIIPPIETENGRVICYVEDTYVRRK